MMMFTVYDVKAKAYLRPFFERTKATALRSFVELVNEDGHAFRKHAEDYSLWYIGDFSEDTGVITGAVNECIGKAIEFLEGVVPE